MAASSGDEMTMLVNGRVTPRTGPPPPEPPLLGPELVEPPPPAAGTALGEGEGPSGGTGGVGVLREIGRVGVASGGVGVLRETGRLGVGRGGSVGGLTAGRLGEGRGNGPAATPVTKRTVPAPATAVKLSTQAFKPFMGLTVFGVQAASRCRKSLSPILCTWN
jgi:hypothetical protein